jgi:hypothetical protein|tara:strand:+ start:2806 stop:2958 length:153 start_codon:yes stop_codon:yes gene_type:complete
MRHFETRAKAIKWRNSNAPRDGVWKKTVGQKNRTKKPFVVGSEMQWLNLN